MIRNIIFDWSGTLVDDLPAVWRASNHVFERAGVEPMSLEDFRAEFALPFKPFYDRYTPHVPDDERESWFHGHFPEVIHTIEDLPHARRFLEFCEASGFKVVLLSAIPQAQYEFLAERNGFARFFQGHELGVRDKRERIHDLLSRHGMNPEETLFIGDMQHDVDAARAGGVHACATLTGYNTLSQLRESEPDLIVEHLGELLELFERGEIAARLKDGFGEREGGAQPVATVGGFAFNEAGEALFLRTHKWSGLWGMPGGKIKYGERSVEAFARELKEETNLDGEEIAFVMAQDCVEPEEFYRKAHFILLNFVCRVAGEPRVELNDEAREFRWMKLEESLKLSLNGPSERLVRRLLEDRNSEH